MQRDKLPLDSAVSALIVSVFRADAVFLVQSTWMCIFGRTRTLHCAMGKFSLVCYNTSWCLHSRQVRIFTFAIHSSSPSCVRSLSRVIDSCHWWVPGVSRVNPFSRLYRLTRESYLIYIDKIIWLQMKVSMFSKLETQGKRRSANRQLGR